MWEVEVDTDKVRSMSEAQVVQKLRSGSLSGAELVRAPGTQVWVALVDTDLYRRAVPHTGDARDAAVRRVVRGFSGHAVAFVLVIGAMSFARLPVNWWMWWGLGLGFHAWATVQKVAELRGLSLVDGVASLVGQTASAVEPVVRGNSSAAARPSVAQAVTASVTTAVPPSELQEAVQRLLDRAEDPELRAELMALAEAGAAMAQQGANLDAMLGDGVRDTLRAEQEDTEAALLRVRDERTRLALERQVRALQERLAGLDAADGARLRLRAQERTLLHEVEGLRLLQQQRAVDAEASGGLDSLTHKARGLRELAEAEAEVDEAMAQARRAALAASRGAAQRR